MRVICPYAEVGLLCVIFLALKVFEQCSPLSREQGSRWVRLIPVEHSGALETFGRCPAKAAKSNRGAFALLGVICFSHEGGDSSIVWHLVQCRYSSGGPPHFGDMLAAGVISDLVARIPQQRSLRTGASAIASRCRERFRSSAVAISCKITSA